MLVNLLIIVGRTLVTLVVSKAESVEMNRRNCGDGLLEGR